MTSADRIIVKAVTSAELIIVKLAFNMLELRQVLSPIVFLGPYLFFYQPGMVTTDVASVKN